MFKKLLLIVTISLLSSSLASAATVNAEPEESFVFESKQGDKVDAYRGSFLVPENRSNKDSRKITIHYVRFPATGKNPGSPIIYLSGGPGGSGIETAKHGRFPLFMAMREHGDVIALDQRGTGAENDAPVCTSSQVIPLREVLSDGAYYQMQRQALAECLGFWKKEGLDIYGYTTPESVSDLDDLRKHLGAEKLSLWGISYGTHLALAAIKTMDDRLDKVILATVEGLDQTVKMPARTDAYFGRLQDAINQNDELREQYPDITAMMIRVHANLDKQPIALKIPNGDGVTEMLLSKRDMQQIASMTISDPQGALRLLGLYSALDNGITEPLVKVMQMFGDLSAPISFRPMSIAMDISSGQSKERHKEIMRQAETSLLGSHLNSTFHLEGVIPNLDLGEKFRAAPKSTIPTLVMIGTLDGRIYPESQLEATQGLSQRKVITVVNAGHNLFMTSPAVGEAMAKFMRGEKIEESEIQAEVRWY